jgi:lipoate-protein ligase A
MHATPAWVVRHRVGTAAELHERWPDDSSREPRTVAVCEVVGPPSIVLGSSQPEPGLDEAESERIGVVVTRRSSGGGAVYVAPGRQVWVDVWIPRGDPLWMDDVIESSGWLGRAWLRALTEAGVGAGGLTVHSGRLEKGGWGDVVCFASIGPGEVCADGLKLVGLSQRRTRDGALFHMCCPLDPPGGELARLLDLEDDSRRELEALLERRATSLGEVLGSDDEATGAVAGLVVFALEGAT